MIFLNFEKINDFILNRTNNIQVVLGAHEIRNTNETTQQVITASKITIHPSWDSATLINDICLLTLEKNATINESKCFNSFKESLIFVAV